MPNKTIEQRVKEIIVEQLGVNEEQLTPEASFVGDLGADSLDTFELVMAFEEKFKDEIKGEIPESDSEKFKTVGDVIKYIEKVRAGVAYPSGGDVIFLSEISEIRGDLRDLYESDGYFVGETIKSNGGFELKISDKTEVFCVEATPASGGVTITVKRKFAEKVFGLIEKVIEDF